MMPFTSDEYAVIAGAIPGTMKKCRVSFAEHFPREPFGEDERPNRLIVLYAAKIA